MSYRNYDFLLLANPIGKIAKAHLGKNYDSNKKGLILGASGAYEAFWASFVTSLTETKECAIAADFYQPDKTQQRKAVFAGVSDFLFSKPEMALKKDGEEKGLSLTPKIASKKTLIPANNLVAFCSYMEKENLSSEIKDTPFSANPKSPFLNVLVPVIVRTVLDRGSSPLNAKVVFNIGAVNMKELVEIAQSETMQEGITVKPTDKLKSANKNGIIAKLNREFDITPLKEARGFALKNVFLMPHFMGAFTDLYREKLKDQRLTQRITPQYKLATGLSYKCIANLEDGVARIGDDLFLAYIYKPIEAHNAAHVNALIAAFKAKAPSNPHHNSETYCSTDMPKQTPTPPAIIGLVNMRTKEHFSIPLSKAQQVIDVNPLHATVVLPHFLHISIPATLKKLF